MDVCDLHVHQVYVYDFVRVRRWHQDAVVRSLLGLGNVAGFTLDAVGQESVFQ